MSNLIHNEQTKLAATFWNNLSVLSLATGMVVPIISLSALQKSSLALWLPVGLGAVLCVAFFVVSQNTLKDLKE
ncbi:hypothetical protein [Mesorhizobium sp. 128a]